MESDYIMPLSDQSDKQDAHEEREKAKKNSSQYESCGLKPSHVFPSQLVI